jgi:hypothetical protein
MRVEFTFFLIDLRYNLKIKFYVLSINKKIIRVYSFLILIIFLSSCSQSKLPRKTISKTQIAYEIIDLNLKDFELISKGDTVFYMPTSKQSFDGKTLLLDLVEVASISASTQFEFSFSQYTIDYNPVIHLPFSKESKWVDLSFDENKIKLADFYGNSDHPSIHSLFGLNSKDDLIHWIIIEDFDQIKAISIDAQTQFYTNLINEKSKYETCCPEYLKQANTFLSKDKSEFKSMVDLAIEMYIKKRTIVLKGIYNNGDPFQLVLVQKM